MAKHLALLLNVLIVSLLAIAAQAQPIFDTDGHELTSDNLYHVLPAAAGSTHGRGLNLVSLSGPCRPLVVLSPTPAEGFPVYIRPRRNATGGGGSGGPPRLSSDVEIFQNFSDGCPAARSHQWYVDLDITKQTHVVAGEHPNGKPSVEVFRVERQQAAGATAEGYKLASCDGSRPCRGLGLYKFQGSEFLTAAEEPHVVVFQKCAPPCL